MKVLLTYTPFDESTQKITRIIEKLLKEKGVEVDLNPVEPEFPLGPLRKIFLSFFSWTLPLKECILNLRDYSIIILGAPVKTHRPSPSLVSFLILVGENLGGRRVGIFLTYQKGIGDVFALSQLKNTIERRGGRVVAKVSFSSRELEEPILVEVKVKKFIESLLKF